MFYAYVFTLDAVCLCIYMPAIDRSLSDRRYRSAGLIALSLCLWAVNILVFELHGVNHVFILQTSPERHLLRSILVYNSVA